MSQIKHSFNFFFTVVDKNDKLTIQDLHKMYKLYLKFNPKLTFLQFYIKSKFLYNYKSNLQKTSLFLGIVFFIKTLLVVKVSSFSHKLQTSNKDSTLSSFISDPKWEHLKWVFFWMKWSKLRRPKLSKTEEDNNEGFFQVFLNTWNKRFETYKNLKFLKNYDLYPLVSNINYKLFKTKVVNITYSNKSLLKTPKLTSSSIVKLLNIDQISVFEFQFLRKNKVYNKGRYSRCRQNYRTGVYMCMYLSIVCIFGLYYWFFKFSFNFTYLWWLFIAFIGSFFIPKIIKYRLYEPITIVNKIFDFFRWLVLVTKSIF